MNKRLLNNVFFTLLVFLFGTGCYWLSYQTNRSNFIELIGIYGGLFVLYYLFIKNWKKSALTVVTIGICARALLLFSFPNLSDDIFRFAWDGIVWTEGINPFLYTPTEYLELTTNANLQQIYPNLNSKDYFTIYPPVLQYFFGAASWLFSGNIVYITVFLKSLLLLAEGGSLLLIIALLKKFDLHQSNVVYYALNPLAIIEITGNVHFEGFMIFFLLLAVWLLSIKRIIWSALAMALAVCSKLLPLMFLPFLIKRLDIKKSLSYFGIVALTSFILFSPFISLELIENLGNSIDLYFRKFEFNASIYYIIRWIGFQVKGWNIIQIAGPALSVITLLSVLVLALTERDVSLKSFVKKMSWTLGIYLGLATIIHPWYVCALAAFSCFLNNRYFLIWSAVVPLSYFAYSNPTFMENPWLIGFEYIAVLSTMYYEWRFKS